MFTRLLTCMLTATVLSATDFPTLQAAEKPYVVYEGHTGPGVGKNIVLVSGDEEYRTEESLPMLARILAERHGFTCTVLFAISPETGEIDPAYNSNIPGLETLAEADLLILSTRWRNLPGEQMQFFDSYFKAGKPVLGIRTATHAFKPKDPEWQHYADGYSGEKKEWAGGLGRLVFGENWYNHHGSHKKESTRGRIAPGGEGHPITRGVDDGSMWGNSDVYGVHLPLPGDSQPLVLGEVLTGMSPDDAPVEGEKNNPMMPIVWTKSYQLPEGQQGQAVTSTIGSATDMADPEVRRVLVNAGYWLLGLQDQIPKQGTDVRLVGEYNPTMYGFNEFKKGLKPSDYVAR